MKLTYAEVMRVYRVLDPNADLRDRRPKGHAINAIRGALEATTLEEATRILHDAFWADPEGSARKIREMTTCSTCGGDGVMSPKA